MKKSGLTPRLLFKLRGTNHIPVRGDRQRKVIGGRGRIEKKHLQAQWAAPGYRADIPKLEKKRDCPKGRALTKAGPEGNVLERVNQQSGPSSPRSAALQRTCRQLDDA